MKNKNITKIGFWSIVLMTINSIVGSGIFISPGGVIKQAGDKSIYIYLIATVFASILAITFASAAKYVSKGGAAYAYAKAAFGENVGYYVGITRFIAAAIAWGVMATAVVKTVLDIFNIETSFKVVTISFICLMLILLLINLIGVKFFELINNISTIGKVLVLFTVIVIGFFVVLTTGENHFSEASNIINPNTGKNIVPPFNLTVLVSATIAAFYAFTGFESIASGSEDMQEPEKNLPKALPLAMILISVIYIGIICVILFLNPQGVVNSKSGVGLIEIFSNNILRKVILYGSFVSMFGINVAASFHTPRILESMSRQKQMPKIFSYRTSAEFPAIAFLITAVIAIIIPMAFSYSMSDIIIISSISRFVQFVLIPIGVIMFYFSKNRGEVIKSANKNFITDVIVPILAFILAIILLYKFSWVKQFTKPDGSLNLFALSAMAIGYIILPLILFLFKNKFKKECIKY